MKLKVTILSCVILLLSACGNDNDQANNQTLTPPKMTTNSTIQGAVFTGIPFNGKVQAIGASGLKTDEVITNADGSFVLKVDKSDAPYLIKAYNDKETYYSFSPSDSENVTSIDVSQLTTAAILNFNHHVNPQSTFDGWAEYVKNDTINKISDIETEMEHSAAVVAANLTTSLSAAGMTDHSITDINFALSYRVFNVFNNDYNAELNQIYNKVLAQTTVTFACGVILCEVNYSVNGQPITWDDNIDTTSFKPFFNRINHLTNSTLSSL